MNEAPCKIKKLPFTIKGIKKFERVINLQEVFKQNGVHFNCFSYLFEIQ